MSSQKPYDESTSLKDKRKPYKQSKILFVAVMLLTLLMLQRIFIMPLPAYAANSQVELVRQRATLPPEWTATFTAAPATAVVQTPIPTLTLGGQSTTAVPSVPTVSEVTGKKVIVDVDSLTIYTWSASDVPLIENAPRGAVKTILVEAHAGSPDEVWWYVADSYGWIPAQINGIPTVRDYTPNSLNQMIQETDGKMSGGVTDPMLHLQKGWMYYNQQNYGSAISEITIAINMMKENAQSNPKEYGRLFDYRGKVYLDMQDNVNALENFNEAIKQGFQDAAVYNRRGIVYQRLGQYEQARTDYEQAIKLNPKYGLLYSNFGALLDDNDPTQLQYYAKAIQTDMYFPYSYTNRASYYRRMGDFSDYVINDLTTALMLLPHDKNILNNRGDTYMHRQEYRLAIQDFDLVIQFYPDFVDAYSNRGAAYAYIGNNQAALADLLKAVKLGDESGLAYYNLGVLLHQDRQYIAALYCYNKALEINPNRRDAQLNRAQIYEQIGGFDEKQIMSNPSVEVLITPMP